jgi:hypothetical protein
MEAEGNNVRQGRVAKGPAWGVCVLRGCRLPSSRSSSVGWRPILAMDVESSDAGRFQLACCMPACTALHHAINVAPLFGYSVASCMLG